MARENFMEVPLPSDNFHPNVRLIVHNTGPVMDPYSHVRVNVGAARDELDYEEQISTWEALKPILAHKVRVQRYETSINRLFQQGRMRGFHLAADIVNEDPEFANVSHARRLEVRTESGLETFWFSKRPSKEDLDQIFAKHKPVTKFRPKPRVLPLRPKQMIPISFGVLRRLSEEGDTTSLIPVKKQNPHQNFPGRQYLALIGKKVRKGRVITTPLDGIVIIDIPEDVTDCLLTVLDFDLMKPIEEGRKEFIASETYKSWRAENPGPTDSSVETEITSEEIGDEDDDEPAKSTAPSSGTPLTASLMESLDAKSRSTQH